MSRKAVIAFVGLWLLASGVAHAQAGPGTSAALPTDAELRVKQAIQSSFRVLPIQNGIILVPRSRRPGVDNVELRDGTIAVNGTVVTGSELRQRLGRDADNILELSYLDPGARRRLLLGSPDETSTTRPAEPEPPTAAPAEPEAPEAAPSAPAAEEPGESRDHRTFRRISHGRVRVGGSITVAEDEEVNGAVVAIGGDVDINGRVRDAVVAVGGNVRLGPRAEVTDDVTTVGGSVSRDENAVVRGQVNEVDFRFPAIHVRRIPWSFHIDPWWAGAPWRTVRLIGTLVRMGLFTLLAGLVLLLAPGAVERVDRSVRTEPWKAALVGFFAQLLFVPLLVVTVVFLAISIIGIPLLVLVPFAVLAFFVALLLGFTGTASAVAHAARDRFRWSPLTSLAFVVVGLLLIWGLTIVGRVLSLPGGPFTLGGGFLLLLGFLVEYAAWTVGLGGTILTRFGRTGPVYPVTVPPLPTEPPPAEPGPDGI